MQEKWNVYHAAIYLRLSKDDGDISFSSKKQESNSIQSQRELLTAFLRQHPEMELYGEYKDDGWTGTNFDRPDFQRMLEDVKAGKINCIVVKDLSRFGRDYILCGKYIEKVFPQLGVRFIAVNDGYDTLTATGTDSIVVPFKNLINDSYSRDISIKVRTNLEVKRRQGACIANFAVYGYAKDPEDKNHLVEDPYAAGVVRDIFTWAVEGLSPGSIASRLNQLGVLSPMEYKKSQGLRFKTQFKNKLPSPVEPCGGSPYPAKRGVHWQLGTGKAHVPQPQNQKDGGEKPGCLGAGGRDASGHCAPGTVCPSAAAPGAGYPCQCSSASGGALFRQNLLRGVRRAYGAQILLLERETVRLLRLPSQQRRSGNLRQTQLAGGCAEPSGAGHCAAATGYRVGYGSGPAKAGGPVLGKRELEKISCTLRCKRSFSTRITPCA